MNLGDDLVGLERGGERALEEVGGLDGARAGLADHRNFRIASLCNAGHLRRRIGVRATAADGAAIADLVMRHVRDGLLEQRMRGGEPLVVEDVAPAHQRAEADAVRADLDLLQARQFPQIDQQRRLCDAERHHRHQALAAGQGLGLAAVIGEQRNGFVDGGGQAYSKGGSFMGFACAFNLRLWNDAGLLSPSRHGPSTRRPCNCGMVRRHAASPDAAGDRVWRWN